MSNTVYGIALGDIGLSRKEAVNRLGTDNPMCIILQEDDASTIEEPVATTTNDCYNYPAKYDPSNTVEMQQNDAYTLDEPVATATNESYNYPAKYDPSNTIETKENEAYVAMP